MAMPEAAVRQDDGTIARQNDIGLPWQGRVMEPETKPLCVQAFAQQQFGFCVRTPDTRHHPAAHVSRNDVSHALQPDPDRDG